MNTEQLALLAMLLVQGGERGGCRQALQEETMEVPLGGPTVSWHLAIWVFTC